MTVLYGSSVADATLTNACQMSPNSGGSETSKTTTVGSSETNNYAEVRSQGGTSATVASIPSPTGKGWAFRPGAGSFATGNWSASIALATATAGASGCNLTVRFYKYSGGSYASIGSITTSNFTSSTSRTVYSFAGTSMSSVAFSGSDLLYADLWWFDPFNAADDNPVIYESSSATAGVANDMQITTSTFTPLATWADTFAGRTVSNGWGTASDGKTWNRDTGAASLFSVGSSEGVAAPTSASAVCLQHLGSTTGADVEGVVRFNVAAVGSTSSTCDTSGFFLRITDATHYYRLDIGSLGQGTLRLGKKNGGSFVEIANAASPISIAATTFYWFRFRIIGTNLYGRIWADGSGEPSAWHIYGSDSDISSGTIGLTFVSSGAGGSTGKFDSLSASVVLTRTIACSASLGRVRYIDATAALSGIWYDANYKNYLSLTIDHNKVSAADQTNFPVLISLTNALLKTVANSGLVQNSSGFDIIFVSSSGATKYDHEIESYTASSGAIVMWVRIPTLSWTSDTVIHLYFNNSTISTSQENKTGVWDSSYKAVLHLKEDPSGTAPQMKDSTSNANHATSVGSMVTGDQTAGQIDGSLSFGGSKNLTVATSTSLDTISTALTASVWVNGSVFDSTYRRIIVRNTFPSNAWQLTMDGGQTGKLHYGPGNGNTTSAAAMSTGTWYYLVMTIDSGSTKLYINGNLDSTGTGSGSLATGAGLGIASEADSTTRWNGALDELRLSNIVRAASIATEYNNQSNPSTFVISGSLSTQRTIATTAALLSTSTRTITTSAALLQPSTRTITSSAALLETRTRTITATVALESNITQTRTILTSAALLQPSTRTITVTSALLETRSRTVSSGAALLQTSTRTIATSAALVATSTRTVASDSALLSLATRTISSNAALLATLTRTISASAALAALRAIITDAALLQTAARTISSDTALLQTSIRTITDTATLQQTSIRTITSSVALLQAATRTISDDTALLAENTRTISTTASLLQTSSRTITSTTALLASSARTITSDVALSQASARTVSASVALLTEKERTITSTGALLSQFARTILSDAALLETHARTITTSVALSAARTIVATAAILETRTRTISSDTALIATLARTIITDASLTGSARTIDCDAALLATSTRSVGSDVSLLTTSTRTITDDGALLLSSTRTIGSSTALLASLQRIITASASFLAGRVISADVALLQVGSRTVGTDTALLETRSRTITASVALLQTAARTVFDNVALLQTSANTINSDVALLQTSTRTVSADAALTGTARVVACTAALQATLARAVSSDGALSLSSERTIIASSALAVIGSRAIACSVSLQAETTRTISSNTALLETRARTTTSDAALSLTSAITINATVALFIQNTRAIACDAAITNTIRIVSCDAALLQPSTRTITTSVVLETHVSESNATFYVRSGQAEFHVRSGEAIFYVRKD